MALRTLIRKLLAGTGWIMNSSINNREARNLLRELVGDKLYSRTQTSPLYRQTHSTAANSKTMQIQMLLPGRQASCTHAPVMTFSSAVRYYIPLHENHSCLRRD